MNTTGGGWQKESNNREGLDQWDKAALKQYAKENGISAPALVERALACFAQLLRQQQKLRQIPTPKGRIIPGPWQRK